MQYTIKKNNGVAEISLKGELQFNDHKDFRSVIEDVCKASDVQRIVLDLEELKSINSAGLGLLLLFKDEVDKESKALTLKSPNGQVEKMFYMSNFDKMFNIED